MKTITLAVLLLLLTSTFACTSHFVGSNSDHHFEAMASVKPLDNAFQRRWDALKIPLQLKLKVSALSHASRQLEDLVHELRLPILSIAVGLVTSTLITWCRYNVINVLSHTLENSKELGVMLPLLGGFVSCIIWKWQQGDVNKGYLVFTDEFSLKRQLLRWFGAVAVVALGTPMAVSSPAGEIGMTVGRLYSKLLKKSSFECAEQQAASKQKGNNNSKDMEILVLAGAAAGFCANFDAPFAGVLYAMEVTSRYRPDWMQPLYFDKRICYLVLASLASSLVKRKGSFSSLHQLATHL